MDNITIYEFLKEKSTLPIGPDNYSNSGELANSSKVNFNNESESQLADFIEGTSDILSNNKATSIGIEIFKGWSKLVGVNFPAVTTIGNGAFSGCSSFKNVNLPSVTTVGNGVFGGCSKLLRINLPSATLIGNYAFQNCSILANINLPVATTIGDYAFQTCLALTSIKLPVVTKIGEYAFKNCTSFSEIILTNRNIVTLQNANAFDNTRISSGNGYIYVPDDLVNEYKADSKWSTYANQIKGISELLTEGV